MRDRKFEKKKKRERTVREKLLRRRESIREENRRVTKEEREKMEDRPKIEPICNKLSKESIMAQIEENARILKALEEEYERETGNRVDMGKEAEKQIEELARKIRPLESAVEKSLAS